MLPFAELDAPPRAAVAPRCPRPARPAMSVPPTPMHRRRDRLEQAEGDAVGVGADRERALDLPLLDAA